MKSTKAMSSTHDTSMEAMVSVVRRRSLVLAGLERADYGALRSGAAFHLQTGLRPDITPRTERGRMTMGP